MYSLWSDNPAWALFLHHSHDAQETQTTRQLMTFEKCLSFFSLIINCCVLRQRSTMLLSLDLCHRSLFALYVFQHLRIPNHARSQLLRRTQISGWPRKPWENGFLTVKECIISVTQDILKPASPFNVAVKGNGCLLNLCSHV